MAAKAAENADFALSAKKKCTFKMVKRDWEDYIRALL